MKKYVLFTLAVLLVGCSGKRDFDATGTFEADEITLSAEASGRILQLDVKEGMKVKQGQMLGEIDSVQLCLQRDQLRFQQEALLAGSPNVQKQVAALREQIATQERELQRLQKMLSENAATQKQCDDLSAQLAVSRSQLEATMATLDQQSSSISRNAAALESQIRMLDDKIGKCHLASPTSGTVLVKYADAGELAVQGKPLLRIANLNQVYLRAYFTSEQLANLKIGQKVKVTADFGGDQQADYDGTISWIASESEFTPKGIQTRSTRANLVYAAKIAVKNDGRIKLGLYGEVKL